MEYTYRKSAFEKPRTYALDENALVIRGEDMSTQSIPYNDIVFVNLVYTPTRSNSNLYMAIIKSNSAKKIKISNQEYVKLATFENRSKDYVKFIKAFHEKLFQFRMGIKFKKGVGTGLFILYMAIFWISGLVFLGCSGGSFYVGQWIMGIIFFLATLLNLRLSLQYKKKNKPGVYDPKRIPTKILPSV